MKNKISENRAEFLRDKFFEYTFKGKNLDIALLESITEPIELDYIAKQHNYDDGDDILIEIVRNPNIDFSTIKMILFRSDVDGYLKNRNNAQEYKLIHSIIQNIEKNMYHRENFYYDFNEDPEVLNFNLELAKNKLPSQLFSKPKGRKIEPNFVEMYKKRNISTLIEKLKIEKMGRKIMFKNKDFLLEYEFPEKYVEINDEDISNYVNNFKFPISLNREFFTSDNELRKAIIKPELVLQSRNNIITLFIFNINSLNLNNALTNVATIMRNEFNYIQAFVKIVNIEENFDKIKRIKLDNQYVAISKIMQIEINKNQTPLYLRLVLIEIASVLFYFVFSTQQIEELNDENTEQLILDHIKIRLHCS